MKTPALLLAILATPAAATCPDSTDPLFRCVIIERNAEVELCREGGKTRYSYRSNGEIELQFTGDTWGGSKRQVQGIRGAAYASAVRNGQVYYAVFIDAELMEITEQGLGSPNPAILQVYASQADFADHEGDMPIARRVCYPPSIEVDSANFGPG